MSRRETILDVKKYIRIANLAVHHAGASLAEAAEAYSMTPTELARQTGQPIDWINKQLQRHGVIRKRRR
jgi:hypothetical protein